MIEVCFFILKLLAIIMLSLVVLATFAVGLVLLVPIRYRSEGSKCEAQTHVTALLTFLNPLLSVTVVYTDLLTVCVRVLGIKVFTHKEEVSKEIEKSAAAVDNTEQVKAATETPTTNAPVSSKGKKILDDISYYAGIYQDSKAVLAETAKKLWRVLRRFLPYECKLDLKLGTGQADLTGYLYAAYCSASVFLPEEVYFEPVWTRSCFEGAYRVKGKLRLIHVVIALFRIILDKDVRRLIEKIRRK